jgi:antitoxin MazE
MQVVLKKWGNSVALRLPSHVLKEANLTENQRVQLSTKKGAILIKPLSARRLTLTELVERISPDNRHDSMEFGRPVGRELL